MDSSAKAIIGQSLDALNEYLKVEAAKQKVVEEAAAAGASEEEIQEKIETEVEEYVAPTQAELAAAVSKEVAGNFFRDNATLIGFVLAAVAVIIILIIIFNA